MMKIIVIGNGMVGFKFCEKLINSLPGINAEIVVFGEESSPAYDRVHLTDFFAGKTPSELYLAPAEWYQQNNIELHLSDPVVRIDRANKQVFTHTGITVKYDYLLICTGSSAFTPAIPGVDKHGVFLYRTIEDLEMITSWSRRMRPSVNGSAGIVKRAAVIGGGLLGLEAARAMIDLGITETHVVEFSDRLMPRQIDQQASKILTGRLEALGLKIHLSKATTEIYGDDEVRGLRFSDDTSLAADMLVISAGIRARDELACSAGLDTGERGGIIVNDHLQTSDPDIYAIGECALHRGMIYGLVAPGYEMAEVVVKNLVRRLSAGVSNTPAASMAAFDGFDMSTKLKLVGNDVASFGDPFITGPGIKSIVFEDAFKGVYKRINLTEDGNYLLGGMLIGDAEGYNLLMQTCKNKIRLTGNPEELIIPARNPSPGAAAAGIAGLPDEAVICSCEHVTKGAICAAVAHENCESPDAIRKCTGAGSGCGGCMPMVKDLMLFTMKQQGKYVRSRICEHFEHSRQELFDLVKIHNLKCYDDVLDTFGKGDGCEICKPLVASVLASAWNEMILEKGNATAQDSNDRFLANIQKGGTYSVVPRIPGGEITPDKLIVIGQVAKDYNLYTKITGGQRIDMFGAHLNDLPFIWSRLIEAGFESGHAYGKALRTVKSCVGSTWCRFGLHDSVSYAIRIEERYRGLRAPHKIKSGVSGCIRECAEAQSKDFGIIATEKGWNLYVCGNGGSKPQHAVLLASDLSDDLCIQYIDRFLMFYIRTADQLTRTATWLNKMEGGIDYLRNVVVNDSLGMAAQWETEMQALVDSYQCEWKEAIENPGIRKRFSHFVNAPEEKDPSIQFDPLREQKRAREWK